MFLPDGLTGLGDGGTVPVRGDGSGLGLVQTLQQLQVALAGAKQASRVRALPDPPQTRTPTHSDPCNPSAAICCMMTDRMTVRVPVQDVRVQTQTLMAWAGPGPGRQVDSESVRMTTMTR